MKQRVPTKLSLIFESSLVSFFQERNLPVELPVGIEHTVESFHIEVVSPDVHFVNAVLLGLTVGSVEKETVGLGNIAFLPGKRSLAKE